MNCSCHLHFLIRIYLTLYTTWLLFQHSTKMPCMKTNFSLLFTFGVLDTLGNFIFIKMFCFLASQTLRYIDSEVYMFSDSSLFRTNKHIYIYICMYTHMYICHVIQVSTKYSVKFLQLSFPVVLRYYYFPDGRICYAAYLHASSGLLLLLYLKVMYICTFYNITPIPKFLNTT